MAYYGNPRANYGAAPYQESAFKMALRNLIAGSAGIGAGLGAVRPGSNFADAFLQSAGRSSLAVQQAQQAAQEYALRQEEAQRRREEDAIRAEYMKAQIANLGKEKPPPLTKSDELAQAEAALGRRMNDKERAIWLGIYKEPPKPEKPDGGPKLGDLNTLSDNFRADKDVQNFTVVRDNYRRIDRSSRLRSGTGDLAAIFSYMRVLDPESVVRETEFKNAESAVGYVQKTYNLPQHWFKGARLTDAGRAEFRRSADTLYRTQKRTYDTKVAMYRRQAKAYGVDPTLVVPDYDDTDVGGDADLIYNPETGELEPAK